MRQRENERERETMREKRERQTGRRVSERGAYPEEEKAALSAVNGDLANELIECLRTSPSAARIHLDQNEEQTDLAIELLPHRAYPGLPCLHSGGQLFM